MGQYNPSKGRESSDNTDHEHELGKPLDLALTVDESLLKTKDTGVR